MIKEIENIEPNTTTDKQSSIIEIKDLHKTFGSANHVLKGVNFNVNQGENLVVLGRSGSGKSVLIKCIVGLISPDKGEVNVFGKNVLELQKEELNVMRLKIGFLFQSGALYDSMPVRENLAFTLRKHQRDLTPDEIENQVIEALDNVGLSDAIEKMPAELSGGMRKRIGLARTLILKPKIILYDEPTTGLDTITSREISKLILDIRDKHKTTSIIITHDMACAKLTADRIIVLKEGVIQAEGTYEELEKSEDEWVRSFFE